MKKESLKFIFICLLIMIISFCLGFTTHKAYFNSDSNSKETNETFYDCSKYLDDYNKCPTEHEFNYCDKKMTYWYNYCLLISQQEVQP